MMKVVRKLVKYFFLLILCTLVSSTITFIYFMSKGNEEMVTVMSLQLQMEEAERAIAGVQDRLKSDLSFTASQLPPSTASQPPPSTASHPPPSTASQPPISTASHPPPSTASLPPPSTASLPPPSTASQPPPSTASNPPPSIASHLTPSTASPPPPSTTAEGTPTDLNPWKDLISKSGTFKLIKPLPEKHRPRPQPRPSNFKPEPHRRSKAGPTFNKDGEPVYPRFRTPQLADFDDVQFEDGEINNHDRAVDQVRLVLEAQQLYRRTLKQYLERLKQNQISRSR